MYDIPISNKKVTLLMHVLSTFVAKIYSPSQHDLSPPSSLVVASCHHNNLTHDSLSLPRITGGWRVLRKRRTTEETFNILLIAQN